VTYVQFMNCSMTRIPKGLTRIFPSMKVLDIYDSKLKIIEKDDLNEYKHLERFHSEKNEHKFLPGDLFEGFKNLLWISFYGSHLNVVESNTSLLYCRYSIYPTHTVSTKLKINFYNRFLPMILK